MKTFEDVIARIGEGGNATASVKGETAKGVQARLVRKGESNANVAAFLDADGDDLSAYYKTFKGKLVKASGKREGRSASEDIIL